MCVCWLLPVSSKIEFASDRGHCRGYCKWHGHMSVNLSSKSWCRNLCCWLREQLWTTLLVDRPGLFICRCRRYPILLIKVCCHGSYLLLLPSKYMDLVCLKMFHYHNRGIFFRTYDSGLRYIMLRCTASFLERKDLIFASHQSSLGCFHCSGKGNVSR